MALTMDQMAIANAVEKSILEKGQTAGGPLILTVERPEPKVLDPFRPLLQFLAGLLAFCLTLIVALFAALNPDKGYAINALISWVLIGISITAVAGTIAIGLLQWAKSCKASLKPDQDLAKNGRDAAIITVVFGGLTVLACVVGALVVAERQCIGKPTDGVNDTELTDLLKVQQENYARGYAEARARDCFAEGDLASSIAWTKIARKLPE